MAILGLGTDIAEIERIEKALGRTGEPFAKRILSQDEMSKFAELKQKVRCLANRFAAKEAASTALRTGIAKGLTFHLASKLDLESLAGVGRFRRATLEDPCLP